MKKLLPVTLIFIAACANTSGVFRVGEDKFQVSTRATWELGGRAGAKRMALQEATSHCSRLGKVLNVINSKEDYGHFEGGTVDLVFTCDRAN